MGKFFSIKGETGVSFDVQIVDKGDCYGLNDSVIHQQDDPLVIFYDTSVEPNQYASSYYMSTLLERGKGSPLWLDANNPHYRIIPEVMNEVHGRLKMYHEGFSLDSFNREEMREVAFLYSDYVKEVSDDIDSLGRIPVTLSEFVENDLQYYVQDMLEQNEHSPIHERIKNKMEFFGYEFEESDEKLFQRASKMYLDMEKE